MMILNWKKNTSAPKVFIKKYSASRVKDTLFGLKFAWTHIGYIKGPSVTKVNIERWKVTQFIIGLDYLILLLLLFPQCQYWGETGSSSSVRQCTHLHQSSLNTRRA